jgi:hypothetical protein
MLVVDKGMSDWPGLRPRPLFAVERDQTSVIAGVMDGGVTMVAWVTPTSACPADTALTTTWLESAWQMLNDDEAYED